MTIWAVDADLIEYEINLAAELPDGQDDWADEIAKGQSDVLELIKSGWWEANIVNYHFSGNGTAILDESKLNTTLLKQFVCFQTFAYYIMPKLSRFSDEDDKFTRKIEYYKAEAEREWAKVIKMDLYDFNADDTFDDLDRISRSPRRWGRG